MYQVLLLVVMMNVTLMDAEGGFKLAKVSGVIDDVADFDAKFGPPPTALRVHCGDVKRINSVGVKKWVTYFQRAKDRHTKLEFVECSPVIVQQINLFRNFACGGIIRSVHLPYACPECDTAFTLVKNCDDLKKNIASPPTGMCPNCGKPAEFDDLPEEYFLFLKS